MIILLHILIALASVAQATYLFFAPSRAKFRAASWLVVATFLSGAYLIATHPVHMAKTCVTGLLYIGAVTVVVAFGHRRLVALEQSRNHQ